MSNCVGFGVVGVSRTEHKCIMKFGWYRVWLLSALLYSKQGFTSKPCNNSGNFGWKHIQLYWECAWRGFHRIVRVVPDTFYQLAVYCQTCITVFMSFNWVVRGSKSHDTIYKLISWQLSRNHGIAWSCDTILKLSKLPINWSSNNSPYDCGLGMIWWSRGAKDTGVTKLG